MALNFDTVKEHVILGTSALFIDLTHIKSLDDLKHVATHLIFTKNPLASAVFITILLSMTCFLLGELTYRHSFVDKLWSITPVFFSWYFVYSFYRVLNLRALIPTLLITIWGIRLTYNFYRKGGYAWQEEDYRWPIIRAKLPRPVMSLFNLTFISFIQNFLLLALTIPVYIVAASASSRWQTTSLNWIDALAGTVMVGCLIIETVADQQQWNYQSKKYEKINAGKRLTGEYAKGFIDTGLWRYSRHPNFLAEQCFWWGVYLFGVAATGEWVQWSMAGTAALTLLFRGSTHLTESITAEKYSKYKQYQASTNRFLLWFPKKVKKSRSSRGGRKSD
jgi:steroid 5-alpha reductase family enzyme